MSEHHKYNELYKAVFPYAVVGWLVTERGYTVEQLDEMAPFVTVMMSDEFKRFIDEKLDK